MSMLVVKELDVHYGAVHALRGVSLTVEPGEIVTLIGANGAGKSTTLRGVSGLVKPTGGSVVFDGKAIHGKPAHALARDGLVHVPEGRGIFANLTVDENLELGAYVRKGGYAAERKRALELFPRLGERLKQPAGTLSGGEQQMLAIGRALIAKPRLLLLDEPSLGLAPQIVQTIFSIIREINAAGTTILLVEQNAHMALQVAHRAYVIEVGAIVMSGKAAELAASDDVRKAYLGCALMFASSVKIYLEDTDAQGIVYHASYLRFFERARSDWLEQSGASLADAQKRGFRFVVYEMKIKFAKAATLGEMLSISTEVKVSSPFRLTFVQLAKRDGELVTRADVDVVCIGPNGDLVETAKVVPTMGMSVVSLTVQT